MISPRLFLTVSLFASLLSFNPILRADDAATPASKPLADMTRSGITDKFAADGQSNGQIKLTRSEDPAGLLVTVSPGTALYPGVSLKPDRGNPWDLSAYSRIEVTVTNTSTGPDKLNLAVRVDDSGGWKNNNAEVAYLEPGETKTVVVTFGISYGKPAYALVASSVSQVLISTNKTPGDPKTFRIDSVVASGAK